MRILGIVNNTHDSGIAVLEDGIVDIVLEEERFNRRKGTHWFPVQSLQQGLLDRGIGFSDIDAITVPWHTGRLRKNFAWAIARNLPGSLDLLRDGAKPQRGGIVFLERSVRNNIRRHFGVERLPPIVQVGHHDAHAAAFFVSPFDEATVLVIDGYGDDASTSAYTGRGNRLQRRWRTSFFNSLGMVYAAVTEHLGFKAVSGEGKVMALAAYGDDRLVARFREVVRPTPDGRYQVDMSYFRYDVRGMLEPVSRKFIETFGPARLPEAEIEPEHMALAHALQKVLEEVVLHMARHLAARFPSRNLVITGGVALNCVANARVARETAFDDVWVPPVASDTGAPLGSAIWHWHQNLGNGRTHQLLSASLGLEYSAERIESAFSTAGHRVARMEPRDLIERTARALAAGQIVGWFQGRFEAGPRALGNRSMLADPRRLEMRETLNTRIKHREWFRPFAPAVLEERAHDYFELDAPDPFMTMAPRVRPHMRGTIPAGIHIDGTARVQTVSRATNPRYYDLIAAFGELTGVPVLLNTSFNDQEPIVATPEEALACFERTGLDAIAIGDYYFERVLRQEKVISFAASVRKQRCETSQASITTYSPATATATVSATNGPSTSSLPVAISTS